LSGRNERGTAIPSLTGHYRVLEGYLNCVVSEFEKFRQVVPKPTAMSLTELGPARTTSFLDNTDEFKAQVSRRVGAMLRVLDTTLLNPK
jgi:hypothetical protein